MAITGTKTEAERLPQVFASARIDKVDAVKVPTAQQIEEKERLGKTALWSIPITLRLLEDQPYKTVRTGLYFHPSFFGDEPVNVSELDSSLNWAWKGSIAGEPRKPSLREALGISAEALDSATIGKSPEEAAENLRELVIDAKDNTFGVILTQRSEKIEDTDEDGNPVNVYIQTDNYDLGGGYNKSSFFGQAQVEGLQKREAKQDRALENGEEVKFRIALAWDVDTGLELDFEG